MENVTGTLWFLHLNKSDHQMASVRLSVDFNMPNFFFNMTTWIHLQKNGTKICQLHIPFSKITPYHSNEEQFSLGSPYILEMLIVKISNGPDFPTGIQTSCDSMATSTMPLACTSSWSLHPGESCTASCSAVDIFPRT